MAILRSIHIKEQIVFLKKMQATIKHENEHDYDGHASPHFGRLWIIELFLGMRIMIAERMTFSLMTGITLYLTILREFIEEHYEDDLEKDKDLQMLF